MTTSNKSIEKLYANDLIFVREAFVSSGKLKEYHWRHALATLVCMKKFGERYGELAPRKIHVLCLASLGHDLLEDTHVSKAELEKRWGAMVLRYIQGMTNNVGDSDFSNYIQRLKKESEEVLLVKFADIYSNTANSIKYFNSFDKGWIENFWIPLLDDYTMELFSRKFNKYPKTARAMINGIKKNIQILKKLRNTNKLKNGIV